MTDSSWELVFHPKVVKDMEELDGSVALQVFKALKKIQQNPLPRSEGGYGDPLGEHGGIDLKGYMKVKLKKPGIRIVYQLFIKEKELAVMAIGARREEDVYKEAEERKGLKKEAYRRSKPST